MSKAPLVLCNCTRVCVHVHRVNTSALHIDSLLQHVGFRVRYSGGGNSKDAPIGETFYAGSWI
jgi:hypothetical protein